jgi:ABC-type bacteriocin/lantibiotic exporter with double-glycine peptidase domain
MRTTAPRAGLLVAIVCSLLGAAGCQLSYTGGARPASPSELDTTLIRAVSTPVVRQVHRNDCGLAALAMVAGAWGHPWTVTELARDVRPGDRGVRLGALRDVAWARGLEAYAIRGTHDDLRRELARGRPVLVGLLLPFERDRALSHYEVAIAIDPRDGSVITIDPASGKTLRRTREVLDAEWKPAGYATLVVVGDHTTARAARAP